MSFPKYPKYKHSGVEHLGEVPQEWEVCRLKWFIKKLESGTSVNAADLPVEAPAFGVLKTSCVYTGDFDPQENKTVFPEELSRLSCPVKAQSLIVSRMNTPDLVGAAGLVREPHDNLYLPDRLWQVTLHDAIPSFIHYWTKTSTYRGLLRAACSGTSSSMQNLGQDEFTSFFLAAPSLGEQAAIADFLDQGTAKIDALIEEQQRLIELLKEKRQAVISQAVTKGLNPSAPMQKVNIDWVSAVPAHWSVYPIKRLFRLVCDSAPDNNDEELLSIYTDIGVRPRKSLEERGNKASTTDGYWRVRRGDFIVNKLLAWMGAIGLSHYDGVTSPAYDILRRIQKLDERFFESMFRCGIMFSEFRRYSRGIMDMRLRLYFEELGQIAVPFPPPREQTLIADFIEEESKRIDNLEVACRSNVALLQERRSALISAAVTGKIDVRNYAPQEAQAAAEEMYEPA